MPEVKFYEQGRRPGDFMAVLDTNEYYQQWAIVLDHTGPGNYLDPQPPNWQVFVNGVMVGTHDNQVEAERQMREYLDGRHPAPGY